MKKLLALTLAVLMTFALVGCNTQQESSSQPTLESSPIDIEDSAIEESSEETSAPESSEESPEITGTAAVAALKGPTAMGMIKMIDDYSKIENGNFNFTISASPDEISPLLIKGDLDIAAVPANLASVLYNKTEGNIQTLAVHTLGVLYIVETGDTIKSVEDLRGKTIYASGKGSVPEYALNYMLSKNGIDPEKDVTIEYKTEHSECVAALASDENGIAMLPEPFVTTAIAKNDKIKVALNMNTEWEKLVGEDGNPSTLITGVLVARKDFVEENPELVEKFLEEYKASIEFVNSNVKAAAVLIEANDIVPAAVATKAIPNCNITYIDGGEMKQKLSAYLQTLAAQNPQAVGGELPADDFYYNAG